MTVVSKKNNNKRIELNVKNLKIVREEVQVFRSIKWTNLDFDDDPVSLSKNYFMIIFNRIYLKDWNSREIKYIVVQRNKRDLSEQFEATSNETIVEESNNDDDENNGGEVMDSSELLEHTRNKTYFYPKFVSMEVYQ